MSTVRDVIAEWLEDRCPAEQHRWLLEQGEQAADAGAWNTAFALAPRRFGHEPLALDDTERAQAASLRPGWDPHDLDRSDAARLYLLLSVPSDELPRRLDDLLATADLAEARVAYRGLALYPGPERLVARAAEGLRSNVVDLFAAIAHRNPFPAEQFPPETWNQMILKALFVGLDLHPVVGLDQRHNPELATMLSDYARERRAAGRPVHPELWRCVGPHADAAAIDLLGEVLATGSEPERDAAALALAASSSTHAAELLASDPERRTRVDSGQLHW